MASDCQFLLLSMWFCLLGLRALHAVAGNLDNNPALLFARLFGLRVLCSWSRCSLLRKRTRGRCAAVPNCYWLILLAGDLESNPGPASVESSLNTSDLNSVFPDEECAPIRMGCHCSYLSCQHLNACSFANT